jgi:hypothetical protein
MVSKEVVTDPTKSGDALTGFDNVAFKATEAGRPIPKLPDQLNRPPEVSQNDVAKKAFDKAWADSGHMRPAQPSSFVQRTSK